MRKGFFGTTIDTKPVKSNGTPRIFQSCAACQLYKNVLSPKMEPFGKFKKGILNIGEAPGCISGDTLVDVAFRDKSIHPKGIQIRHLVGNDNFLVYSYDIEKDKLVLGKAKKVWKTGIKKVWKVTYEWWISKSSERKENSIKVTSNHPFLLKNGKWKRNVYINKQFENRYVSIDDGLCIGVGIEPLNRNNTHNYSYIYVNGVSTKESRFLLEYKLGRKLMDGEQCHHNDENKLNDTWDNLKLKDIVEHSREHITKNNPMYNPVHKETHKLVMESSEYKRKQSEKRKEILANHKITAIEYIGEEEVYDIEIEKYHNFAANGIFVHNSTEDERGKQWQGKVGRLLQRTYPKFDIDLFEDCLNINSVNCRPMDAEGSNRAPTSNEIACCRNRVLKVIEEYKPKVIILLGGAAVESLIGYRWKKDLGGIGKWHGWIIPDRDFNAWVCPVYHPSFVERSSKEVETIWWQDLKAISNQLSIPMPEPVNELKQVEIISDLSILPAVMKEKKVELIATDFETTGLKPQDEGHEIVCASIATSANKAYSFMVKGQKNLQHFLEILSDENIKKIAHQIKFEDTWSEVILKCKIKGWFYDTMLMAHILDNRPDITNLEFQVYSHFGNITFKNETDAYLESKDGKNGNSKNRILELISTPGGRQKLLVRCGLDSLYEYKLAILQNRKSNQNCRW